MCIENELIKDIIERAPINSCWEFTYSWDRIEDLFNGRGIFNYEFKIFSTILDDIKKGYFISILDKYNFSDWIVHQTVKSHSGKIIFESFDHLAFSLISSDFPENQLLLNKYSEADLLELKWIFPFYV